MIAALLLVGYAVVAGVLGARVLARTGWAARRPRSGVLAWQALTTSVLLAVLLAGAALALPSLPVRAHLAQAFGLSPVTVAEHYGTPFGPWPGHVGLVLVTLGAVRLGGTTIRGLRERAEDRRDQRAALLLVGRPHPDGFTVVDHDRPLVYCLPGTVVLSSGALELLTARETQLVVGHERRHLQGRHHLALAHSETLARAFARVPLFVAAHQQVRVLVEMAADDTASTEADRWTLARALVALGAGGRPESALGAADTAALRRVRRLTAPAPRPRLGQAVLAGAAAVVVLSVPVTLALAPAVEATTHDDPATALERRQAPPAESPRTGPDA